MDVGAVLLDILIVLIAAKVAGEIAERIGLPVVVVEIVAGIIIGSSVLDLVGHDQTLEVLAELGVILLLLQVGLEMNLGELRAVGRVSSLVAIVGVVVPMVAGYAVAGLFDYDSNTSLFLGAALVATSVGITARVFADLRALGTVEARTVLGAAVADDVLGLLVLTVVVRIVTEGTVSVGSIVEIVLVAVGFLVVAVIAGTRLAPPLFDWLRRSARSPGTLVAIALAFTLALSELAEAAELAPIIGAFVAGLALSQSDSKERIERELAPLGHVFIPVFFLGIGIEIDVTQFASWDVLGIAGALLVCAVIGKLVAAVGAFRAPGDGWTIGFGMLPRGEVGLIFATIGLQQGVLGGDLYAALLLVVLVTTLMAPPLLRWRLQTVLGRPAHVDQPDARPATGWLTTSGADVELAATPPAHEALHIGLDAAFALARSERPGPELLAWFGELGASELRWDAQATEQLVRLLQDGNIRSWRFLEAMGLLERALPEIDEAVKRRRADPFVLEPGHVLHFELVERVRETRADDAGRAAYARLTNPERVALAALVIDAAGEDGAAVPLARRLSGRLDLGADAEQELALLVGDSGLLRAGASRLDGLEESSVLQLATHLGTTQRALGLYVLTLAIDDLEPWDRERLDELLGLLEAVLDDPEVTGLDARNLVERRRQEAMRLATDDATRRRIETAPYAYLLTQTPEAIVRHAELLAARGRRDAAVHVIALDTPNDWRVDVAVQDRPGYLARVAGVLADAGLDVLDAVVATWDDGAALETFHVTRALLDPAQLPPERLAAVRAPAAAWLEEAIAGGLRLPLASVPNPDAEVVFDDAASPWYTRCEVRSPDRRGLLHMIAVGIAAAGANIHTARLVTTDGNAVDRFELTDTDGRKLDDTIKDAIVDAVVRGVTPPDRQHRWRRRLLTSARGGRMHAEEPGADKERSVDEP